MKKKKSFIAWLLGDVFHYRDNVVYTNLSRCFPEKSYDEIKQIRDRFYQHFADIFNEMLWFGKCKGDRGRKRLHERHLVEITNPEELNKLFAGAPQMMIMQTHAGNWELISGFREYSYSTPLEILPEHIGVSYVPLTNKFWDRFVAKNRVAPVKDQGFEGYIDYKHILRYVLTNRSKKKAYVFITDQYPYWRNAKEMKIRFMNQDTVTMSAAAELAVKMDMSVVYMRFRTREDGGYTMTFVPISEHAAGENPEEIMKTYYSLLEEDLREQPWNYLWTHKRWK